MYPHPIRLRGPWEATLDTRERVDLPHQWPAYVARASGRPFMMARKFGVPRVLDADERVWLVVRHLVAEVTLNGRVIGSTRDRLEVTGVLAKRNEIQLNVVAPTATAPEVRLEIVGQWYLSDLVIRGRTLTGNIVGPANSTLELYVLSYGRTAVYQPVQAAPFTFEIPEGPFDGPANREAPAWRVELVEGSNKWYVADFAADLTGPIEFA